MTGGAPLDYALAKANPWGLSAGECTTLRLKCQLGLSKIVAAERGVTIKTVERHLEAARKKMGYPSADVRLFLAWHDWHRQQRQKFINDMSLGE